MTPDILFLKSLRLELSKHLVYLSFKSIKFLLEFLRACIANHGIAFHAQDAFAFGAAVGHAPDRIGEIARTCRRVIYNNSLNFLFALWAFHRATLTINTIADKGVE